MSRTDTLRFRHSQAILAAAVVAFIGALPVADARWYLTPVLLVPLGILVWAWRAGTDADAREVRVRALFGQRRLPWGRIAELAADPKGRAVVRLDDGERVTLPAVRGADLPRLVAVTGQPLDATPDHAED
ncbi:PH domain-containing protein [Micromonospora pallida]|uniref:PH domain-containing protein n=1 Tax=Micromonospora pallida TaxID=145854 RepID=A0A1C6SXZ3_9ACTN|nr:PH domain-containing protein [Micromonospora pallida]SCL34229.1 PH domain-containing protein [Micromonospora pallida]